MKFKFYLFLPLIILIAAIFSLSACNKPLNKPIATITMNNKDTIKIALYPDIAPNTVENFVYLANKGFYNGLTFHRIVPKKIIQGGDPKSDGTGGPDYFIKGEFTNNSFINNLKHTKGVIAMARSSNYNSAGSQFFIALKDLPELDNDYATFGKVISGFSNCKKIAAAEIDSAGKPKLTQTIKKITIKDASNMGIPKKISKGENVK